MTPIVEKFEGTPVTELSIWQLIRYNVALTQANVACGAYATGTVNEAIYASFGITFEVVKVVTNETI